VPTSTNGSPPWRVLLDRALACLDGLPAQGLPVPPWTFGGGTVLMLRYEHRLSRDVDIFLRDAQALTALSPRLNRQSAELSDDYVESCSRRVRQSRPRRWGSRPRSWRASAEITSA
jgi:hypothetical protein